METIRCVVERITYTNEDNGFTVLKVRVKNYADLVTVVGNMASVNAGSVLTMRGEWKNDAKHGRQFAVSAYEETLPATVHGIERYLGSGLIKGVGPQFAKRIVSMFGTDTLDVIEQNPDDLIKVEGIGKKRVGMIKQAWQDQKEIKNIMLFLQDHGVSTTIAVKIFKTYGNESIETVKTNPYKLMDDIWGVGFKTSDAIAMKMGFDREGFFRCRSGLLHVLNELSGDGHCYAPRDDLIEKATKILDIETSKLHMTLDQMLKDEDLICEAPDHVYLMPLYHSENGTARRLRTLLNTVHQTGRIDAEKAIESVKKATGLDYDDVQKDAIRKASVSKVMVLTGGPGTGKTTTTKGIISVFRKQSLDILLAAPTGRAAKRLSETTGMEAKTIHRLLEYKPPAGYSRDADHPLEGDVLIVDESSMIDIVLMYNLLKAVPDAMTVIFVGDADQLPSVGPGNVLKDMIASDAIPVVKLTRIYRQAQSSRIITNAHRVNRGEFPELYGGKNADFFYIEENEPANIPALVSDLCAKRLPGHYKASPIKDIQVLCPMQRGETGAANMNQILQNTLNPGQLCLRRGGTEYRTGDKIMQIKNNYDKEVFNGDIGIITQINAEDRTLVAQFDSRELEYDISELDELVLAYATTIHKAQGSEYPIVVMPVSMQHFIMLQRNLLYTGITRAKKVFVLVGSKKAIGVAVRNNTVAIRNTGLAERLRK